jgi:hypothetical protein
VRDKVEDRYKKATERLRKRTDTLEALAMWKEDLARRLAIADVTMRVIGQPLYDITDLEREVELFYRVMDVVGKSKWMSND